MDGCTIFHSFERYYTPICRRFFTGTLKMNFCTHITQSLNCNAGTWTHQFAEHYSKVQLWLCAVRYRSHHHLIWGIFFFWSSYSILTPPTSLFPLISCGSVLPFLVMHVCTAWDHLTLVAMPASVKALWCQCAFFFMSPTGTSTPGPIVFYVCVYICNDD